MVDPRDNARPNVAQQLLQMIPGFHGYLEKENRREADALVRRSTAERLDRCKQELDVFMRGLSSAGKIDDLPRLEQVRSRLDRLQSSVRGEVRGYSGFFDYVQVDERMLDQVYERDLGMLEGVQTLLESIQQLRTKPDAPQAVAADLDSRIEALETHFRRRRELLEGLDK